MSESTERVHCRFVSQCPMFPIFQNKHVLRIYQIQYCESRFEECERYKLASKGTMPAPELLPDGRTLSERE